MLVNQNLQWCDYAVRMPPKDCENCPFYEEIEILVEGEVEDEEESLSKRKP